MKYTSIYDFLLTPGIKELSMKEITMHLSDQNYKSQLNLIFFSKFLPSFVLIVSKLNQKIGERFNSGDYLLSETDPWTLS